MEWEHCHTYLIDASLQGRIGAKPSPIKDYWLQDYGILKENKGQG